MLQWNYLSFDKKQTSFATWTYMGATVKGKAWSANKPKNKPEFILLSFSESIGFRGGCCLIKVTDT